MKNSNRIISYRSGTEGMDTVTYFFEASNEVVAFDAQLSPDIARRALTYLRQFTDKPITWLVITQPTPDKFNGSSIFQEAGAKILCSVSTTKHFPEIHSHKEFYFKNTTTLFRKKAYPKPPIPNLEFSDSYLLTLSGNEEVYLRSINRPAAAACHTVAHIPSLNSLITGDIIHHKAHCWLEGGLKAGHFDPDIESWITILNDISQRYPLSTIAYGGRGRNTNLKDAVEEQTNYLRKSLEIIQSEIRKLGFNAKEFLGPNSEEMYKDLATKFQLHFPEHELPYLIEGGTYSLVEKILHSQRQYQ
ncbi:MBL fold metallo-hydrolase [Bdellovibrio bacteriovorus]|uniref:Metallo-beta-lactamase family protein n=1 Tax=Bdellovibrio bacteriovorus str. Tiberius TaxID=1069642 RepID=K7Z8K3_BDEBC|nr:MBL fold metallo-hydrolase [Bdellovibrio bacteriovorus]AFY00774.1 metallo-beta-lactamase family protein [Bdellovibrio bacteriovorus str. Tiberius]